MNSKVKDFILLETREAIIFNKFDEIYYIFEQIIDYDIASYAIEGISERMTDSLYRIAVEKTDRADMIFCFLAISNCFEPYVKKVLYLINKEKYDELRNKKNSSLPDYLDALGLKVFLTPNNRSNRSEKIFLSYKLRNIDSHECRKWSFFKIYENLQNLLCAYLIVAEKHLEELKKVFSDEEQYNKRCFLNIESFKKMRPEIILKFIKLGIYCMDPMVKSLKVKGGSSVSISLYNKEGLCVSDIFEAENYTLKMSYIYQGKDNIYKTEQLSYINSNGVITKEKEGHWIYQYNTQGKITEAVFYKYKNGKEHKRNSIFLTYFSDGSLQILERKHESHSDIDMVSLFDNKGRLNSVEYNGHRTVYKYKNDRLTTIIGTSVTVDVQYIGCEQLFIEKETNMDDTVLKEKRIYNDNLLIRVERYRKKKDGEGYELSISWDIEYQD